MTTPASGSPRPPPLKKKLGFVMNVTPTMQSGMTKTVARLSRSLSTNGESNAAISGARNVRAVASAKGSIWQARK